MPLCGLVTHPDMLKHDTGPGHPERPERVTAILEALRNRGLSQQLLFSEPQPAALRWLTTVHESSYIERARKTILAGNAYLDSPDTPVCPDSFRAALLAAGAGIHAADLILSEKLTRVFCPVRPPGHHAEKAKAMGFCIFNNVAVAARYLQEAHGVRRIFIVDWDVHHGNGTQHAFYTDPSVFYFSTHQFPHYPGTGAADERGKGLGEGFTYNVPLPAGSGDAAYTEVFEEILLPLVENFRPDFFLISAGFDPHLDDPLSGMQVTEAGFRRMTRIIRELANQFSKGRIISFLEGGYNLRALGESASVHVEELLKP